MFIPYGTDAPVYHWPITTVLMIVANIAVFCALLAHPEHVDSLVLEFGNGLHPAQWVTSNFVHGDLVHLLGNMIFLWTFGLIVEEKLGWYKTLALYLGMGVVQCAVEQTILLGASGGGAYGASGIVFGFMAMSLIWAPENEMQCVFILFFRPFYFEMKVIALVGLFLALEVGEVLYTDMVLTSAVLHLLGAVLGFGVSLGMLKAELVDCENWDVFSVWSGRNRMTRE